MRRTSIITLVISLFVLNIADLWPGGDREKLRQETAVRSLYDYIKPGPEGFPLPENSVELKSVFSFPQKDLSDLNIYLLEPTDWTINDDNQISILDAKTIFAFDEDGRFKYFIPRDNKELSEYNILSGFCFWNQKYVSAATIFRRHRDNKNLLLFIDKNGKISDISEPIKSDMISLLAVSDEGVIYCQNDRILSMEQKLVRAVTKSGKTLFEFGAPLYSYKDINKVDLALDKQGNVFMAFRNMPVIRKYSADGNLIFETRIPDRYLEAKEKMNLEIAKESEAKDIPGAFYPVIVDMNILEERLYLLTYYPRIEIFECDLDGKVLKVYWKDSDTPLNPVRLLVRNILGKKRFFVMQANKGYFIEAFEAGDH